MGSDEASALVRSLVGRLVRQDGAYRLPEGILSGDDVAALRYLAGMPAATADGGTDAVKVEQHSIAINRAAFDAKGPPEENLRLCLDFGTAMSKAWASGGAENETIPLVLGRPAKIGDVLAVPSSVFISGGGRIYLGAAAETQHRQEISFGRQRFDNLKRMLSEVEVGLEFDDVPLSAEIDPTHSGLTKGDLFVLYLAWLTDLALEALEDYLGNRSMADKDSDEIDTDRPNLRYVRRRFAIPCFEHAQDETVGGAERAAWARRVMERNLLRAQVVADTLRGMWNELSVENVRPVLAESRKLDTAKLTHLMAETAPVREPIAAGASRFQEEIVDREVAASTEVAIIRKYLLVIDAGAGTTDFALFQVFWDSKREETRYALITPTVRMCRIAGNAVDSVLQPIVLEQCGIDPKSGAPRSGPDFDLIKIDLNAQIRVIKRQLFTTGNANIELRPNVSGTLAIDQVLEDSDYQRLGEELLIIRDTVLKSTFGGNKEFLEEIKVQTQRLGRSFPIYVLLTGGSSALPIVKKLSEGKVEIDGAPFGFFPVEELPRWIDTLPREDAELVGFWYSQCAVAIGGSVRELPIEIQDLGSPVTPPRSGTRKLERYQVTGV